MTDNEPAENGEVTETQGSGIGNELSATVAKLGAGEKLAVLGAAGVLVVWLLFDLLIDEYSTGQLPFVLALGVVVAAYLHHNRGSEEWSIDYRTLVVVGAGLLGILGAWFLIEEIRNDILDADGATVLGAILFWAASIVSGVGAWQLTRK